VGDITWRAATFDDVPDILRIWKTTERILGPQDKPMLFARPVLLTLVAETDAGEIVDALYLEATVDITKIGCSRLGFDGALPLAEDLRSWLRGRGYRMARITVPVKLRRKMAGVLRQFKFWPSDGILSHWIRRL
jgi:hypothetical protein